MPASPHLDAAGPAFAEIAEGHTAAGQRLERAQAIVLTLETGDRIGKLGRKLAAVAARGSSWRDTEVTTTLLNCSSDRSDSSLASGAASAFDITRLAQATAIITLLFWRIRLFSL
jgi:hypothetical protein